MRRRRKSERLTVHLAASGGGHLELLDWLAPEATCTWVVSPGARASALVASGAQVHQIPNPGRSLGKIASNLAATVAAVLKDPPRLVVTTGAGSVVPYAVLARMVGAKLMFIETTARVNNASKSGRVLSKVASSTLVQWPEMASVYRGAIVCRPTFFEEVRGSTNAGKGTFVAVGTHSEPFDRLLRLVDEAVGEGILPTPVVAQSGVSTYRPHNFQTVQFLTPDALVQAAYDAQYVVCHGGSGLISTALRAGRRPLVVPRLRSFREHFDDHQLQLAARLQEMGLVVWIEEAISAHHVTEAHSINGQSVRSSYPSLPTVFAAELARLMSSF